LTERERGIDKDNARISICLEKERTIGIEVGQRSFCDKRSFISNCDYLDYGILIGVDATHTPDYTIEPW
jgi:hypothetical protein